MNWIKRNWFILLLVAVVLYAKHGNLFSRASAKDVTSGRGGAPGESFAFVSPEEQMFRGEIQSQIIRILHDTSWVNLVKETAVNTDICDLSPSYMAAMVYKWAYESSDKRFSPDAYQNYVYEGLQDILLSIDPKEWKKWWYVWGQDPCLTQWQNFLNGERKLWATFLPLMNIGS